MRLIFYLLFFIFFQILGNAENIIHIKIDNAISPATSKYLTDSFLESKKHNATLMLIELDTPGGLVTSMRKMIQTILNSEIPVVMYVSPKGARAASAGTFLMYASHIAVMSPGTNIGAATPVNLMPSPKLDKQKNEEVNKKTKDLKTAMEKKVINDISAYIKSIAELRNRNIKWALEAVKEGKSISANEALEKNVIDLIANDVFELLEKIHGKKVKIDNKEITINTEGVNVIFFEASWKIKFLTTISNPNIAYIFLIVAMYGILLEMMNPGSIFPGVIGAVSALIAFYALNILPFNYVGLLLIFLGVIFMIMEVLAPGFGIMGIAGVIAFAFGSVLLFDEETIGSGVSLSIIFAFSLVSLAFFVFILGFLIKIRKSKPVSGVSNLIGLKVKVIEVNDNSYKILCNGELWNARSKEKFNLNDDALIKNIKGLTLEIRSTK